VGSPPNGSAAARRSIVLRASDLSDEPSLERTAASHGQRISALCKPGRAIGKLSGAKGTTRAVDDALGAAIVLGPTGLNTMRCARERARGLVSED